MNQIGLDIGNNMLKAVSVKIERNSVVLESVAKAASGKLGFLSDSEKDQKEAIEYLTDFVLQNGFLGKSVNISIPESLIFSRILQLPKLKDKDLNSAVRLEIEQDSPFPLSEASMTFQVLPAFAGRSETIDVLAVVAPKNLTEKLHKLLSSSGLKVSSIEPESIAMTRSLIDDTKQNPPTLIANIGHTTTSLAVYSNYAVRLTRPFPTGFNSLVKAVSQELDLEMIQAEEYVKTYGLTSDKLNGKIKTALNPVYAIILNEIKRAMTYFETRGYLDNVKRVVVCGGGSTIPGIVVYSANFLGTEVEVADPWEKFKDLGKYKDRKKELEDIGPIFTTAAGLALKSS